MCLSFLYNLFNWIIIQWGIIMKCQLLLSELSRQILVKIPQYKTTQKSIQWEPCHSIGSDIHTDKKKLSHFLLLFCKQSSKYITMKYTSNSINVMKFNLGCIWTDMDRNKIHIYFGKNPPILNNSEVYALVFNCLIMLHIII